MIFRAHNRMSFRLLRGVWNLSRRRSNLRDCFAPLAMTSVILLGVLSVRWCAPSFGCEKKDVPNTAQMMLESEMAITAGGRVAYELAATGTPGIIVPSNDHELQPLRQFIWLEQPATSAS